MTFSLTFTLMNPRGALTHKNSPSPCMDESLLARMTKLKMNTGDTIRDMVLNIREPSDCVM